MKTIIGIIIFFAVSVVTTYSQTFNMMYYVSARPGEHGIWVTKQQPEGSFSRGNKVIIDGVFDGNAVDPDIMKQNDGSLRLYYFKGYFVSPPPQNPGPNPIYTAISNDGVNFSGNKKVFEYEGIFDPSVVKLPNGTYVMGCTQSVGTSINTVIATSNDGLQFTYKTTVQNTGIPELLVLADGTIRLFYNGAGGIVSSRSVDGGNTWQKEQGVRLSYQQFVGDPSVSSIGNTLRMYVKGFNANGGQKLVGHKTQYAESSDGGNSFIMQQILVLDSASVPEGVTVPVSITIDPKIDNQAVCKGEATTLSVNASTAIDGTELLYQWKLRDKSLIDNAFISGSTTKTLTIKALTESDTGVYTCQVQTQKLTSGKAESISQPFFRSLISPPHIIQEPIPHTKQCRKNGIVVECKAEGDSLRYQWYDVKKGKISSGTFAKLSISSVDENLDSTEYYCIVTGKCGNDTSAYSRFVFTPLVKVTKNLPINYAVPYKTDTTLYVGVEGESYSYQWYRNEQPITAIAQSSASVISYSISSISQKDSGEYYVRLWTDCDTSTSVKTMISVIMPTSIEEETIPSSICRMYDKNTLLISTNKVQSMQIVISDLQGNIVKNISSSIQSRMIAVDELASGMYFVRIKYADSLEELHKILK